MKKVLFMLMIAIMLTACSAKQVEDRLDAAGDMVEEGMDKLMDTGSTEKPKLTEEEAVNVALKHAGTTAEQVTGLRTEYEVDDGVGHYDVRFLLEGQEYDYEVDASSGSILSYEKDD